MHEPATEAFAIPPSDADPAAVFVVTAGFVGRGEELHELPANVVARFDGTHDAMVRAVKYGELNTLPAR